jgi:uncharacterized protein (DUF305 family)
MCTVAQWIIDDLSQVKTGDAPMKAVLAAIIGIVLGYAGSGFLPLTQLKDTLMQIETPDMSGGHELNVDAGSEDHSAHSTAATPADAPESTKQFAAANDKMHKDMAIAFTGNADKDFVAGMIPHHQGAIDMAKVVLQFGTDPEIKALATGIISAQEAEIAQMKTILGRLGQ